MSLRRIMPKQAIASGSTGIDIDIHEGQECTQLHACPSVFMTVMDGMVFGTLMVWNIDAHDMQDIPLLCCLRPSFLALMQQGEH